MRPLGRMVLLASAATLALAEAPHEQASRAFDAYAGFERERFLAREELPTREEGIVVRPGRDEGIVQVPGGLLHHWVGSVFLRGITLETALEVALRFPEYRSMYRQVLDSKLVGREGEKYWILLRVREGLLGANAILDIRSRVEVIRPGRRRVCLVSVDEEIRQVENAGRADERLLAREEDSGYLWRSGMLTRFAEDAEGVHMEIQTLGLSRDFPMLLRWITDLVSRRIGRNSVEQSLEDFRAAALGAGRAQTQPR